MTGRDSKFRYYTTPIYYASGQLHAGHLYTSLLVQILKNHELSKGNTTKILTGMDEHGEKIAEKAALSKIPPQQFVDGLAEKWQSEFASLGLSFDIFLRTSSPEHKETVQKIFQYCYEKGDIYFGEHEGWYCVDCESFLTDAELSEEKKCRVHDRPAERRKEGNYYFRTTKYTQAIKSAVQEGKLLRNRRYANELLGLLDALDSDLSVSRPKSRTTWGIELPFDQDHIAYVWFDALPNYLTGIGGLEEARTSPYWQNATHVLGKDILKFHGVFWPAMLLSLDLPLPELIVHGWLLQGGEKMAKSKGNAVTLELIQHEIGKDAFVSAVFRLLNPGDDLEISKELLTERYNADLANGLGNLFSRTMGLTAKAFDGFFPDLSILQSAKLTESESLLLKACGELTGRVSTALDKVHTADALQAVWEVISLTDKLITDTKPWALLKETENPEKQERLRVCLALACSVIRTTALVCSPFFPEKMEELLRYIGEDTADRGSYYARAANPAQSTPARKLDRPPQLFPRQEAQKSQAQDEPAKNLPAVNVQKSEEFIDFQEFEKVQIRVAHVEKAELVPGADKLLRLELFLGDLGSRVVFSGIRKWVQPEDIAGRNVLVAANLKPRKMKFGVSEGMVLSTENAEGAVEPVYVSETIAPGSRLV